MKKFILFWIGLVSSLIMKAQLSETDSLKQLLTVKEKKSEQVVILENLSYAYLSSYPDTALQYALEGLRLAENIDDKNGIALCTNALGSVYFHMGDYSKALELYLQALKMKEELKSPGSLAVNYFNIANVYTEQKDYAHALHYLFKTKQVDEKAKDTTGILFDLYSLSAIYLRMKNADSAIYHANLAYQLAQQTGDKNLTGAILNTFGEIYALLKNSAEAIKYFHLSNVYADKVSDNEVLTANYLGLAKIYDSLNLIDSSFFYARKALAFSKDAGFMKQVLESSSHLAHLFNSSKRFDSAYYYQSLSYSTKDSLFNVEQVKKVQNLKLMEQQRQQSLEAAKTKYRNKVKFYLVIFVSIVFLFISVLLWRNNKQKQKAFRLLQQQKSKTDQALEELKSTQMQLVQREKMASLGELMAGIAHEIQNPLNFVNNFSEVNTELLEELKQETKSGSSQGVIELAEEIQANEHKINHHGKRADAIVKNMLQHSQLSSGTMQATDINALVQEYLRLTYHGMKTKDRGFQVNLKMDLDPEIEQINVLQQDLGRVLLNLLNNAFFAVSEKQKRGDPSYEPEVFVSTKKSDGKIEIRIRDNGTGIPQTIIDKIFQPFFTTKSPGEGTGLGLSLSYEIITKGHGGELEVKTEEGEFTEFTLRIPENRS